VGQDSSGHKSVEAVRQQHAAWRYRRQQLLHLMEQSCGSWPDLLHPFGAVLQLLREASEAELDDAMVTDATRDGAPAGSLDGPVAAAAVVASARQVALARCQLLRDILLLLGLARQTRCIGKRPLTAQQMQQIGEELLPAAHGLLQRAAVAYWLSRTPASRAKQQAPPPATLPFGSLRISSSGGAPEQAASPAQDAPLALRLLPGFCQVEGAPVGPAALAGRALRHRAAALVAFLQLGRPGDAAAAGLGARVLQLGYELFLQREYSHLDTLVHLAGGRTLPGAGRGSVAAMPRLSGTLPLGCWAPCPNIPPAGAHA
jgi:hypothetical protein